MCRIINFECCDENSGCHLISNIAKLLASDGNRVCVIDFDFGINLTSYLFSPIPRIDIKEYFEAKCLQDKILNSVTKNLFVIKTSNSTFDYQRYLQDFEILIKKITEKFDYIMLVGGFRNGEVINLKYAISSELIIIIDNEISSIRYARLALKKAWGYDNLKNKKIILNNYRIIKELKGKLFSKNDIEEILKVKVLCVVPKLNLSKIDMLTVNKILLKSVEENTPFENDYKKRYKGIIGFFRRRLYEKFE